MLLGRRANPNARERLGQTALMWAAAEGHTAIVRALIAAGADTNAKTDSGFTPFFFAVREGRLDTVRAFLAAGADANAMMQRPQDEAGPRPATGGRTSPLLLAVQNAHFELAIALIDAGADPNDRRTGFTPLHLLPGVRKPDSSDGAMVRLRSALAASRALNLYGKSSNAARMSMTACRQDRPGCPRHPHKLRPQGPRRMLFAADRSDVPLMRLLLELGADPLLPNVNNTTPLMAAAGVGTREALEEAGEENEALEAVAMLLDRGADVNGVDNNGDTAMHGAAANNYPRVVNLLANRGADPKVWSRPNKSGRTPLYIAEGYVGVELRPDPPTIAAVTKLMLAAGLSLEGQRPAVVDQYRVVPAPPRRPHRRSKTIVKDRVTSNQDACCRARCWRSRRGWWSGQPRDRRRDSRVAARRNFKKVRPRSGAGCGCLAGLKHWLRTKHHYWRD
jgi:ankyrin repeat protein